MRLLKEHPILGPLQPSAETVAKASAGRIAFFQDALVSRGNAPETLLRYRGLLKDHESEVNAPAEAIVRLESPGEFTPGFRRHYLLEVNAFGDLLPGIVHRGCDTYQAEIDSVDHWKIAVRDSKRFFDS